MPANLRAVQPHDPFRLEGTEPYSIDKFYTSSKNRFDHRDRINLSVLPEMLAEVQELISGKIVPDYKSFQDFTRDAIHHRMEYLRKVVNDPKWDRYVEAERRRLVFARIEREMDSMHSDLEMFRERLVIARERGDKEAIQEILDYCEIEIENYRDPYRARLADLMTQFKR